MRYALGLDLGGTKLLACLIDETGRPVDRTVRSTGRATGPEHALKLMIDAAHELRDRSGGFDCAGVGFPGLVDFPRGIARSTVMLDGWLEVPLAARLSAALDVPCVVDNDVNAAAVAELGARGEDGTGGMLFVAVGTGIGGALVLDGKLWRGSTGVAGEIGNLSIDRHGPVCWCGRRGCLNTFSSGSAIEAASHLPAGLTLAEAYRTGHPGARAAVHAAAEALGFGLANALNLLNPALVVLGGGVAQLGEGFLEAVARGARAEAFPEAGGCRFELARAGYEAGAVGAGLLALACGPGTSVTQSGHDH